jgi:hypothetical protein
VYPGIDVGTSGVKAGAVNETGAIVATWRRSALPWFSEITERVLERIAPPPGSGRQEVLENFVNRCVWRLYSIQTP